MTARKQPNHINKFMQGRMTPREAHARFGIRKQCAKCQQPATNRIKVLVVLTELEQRRPEFVAMLRATSPNSPLIPTIDTKYGKMVMLHDMGSCGSCLKSLEVQAAHGAEDWMLVEIDRGPANINPQIMMPRG